MPDGVQHRRAVQCFPPPVSGNIYVILWRAEPGDGWRCFEGSSWCIERDSRGADIQVQIVGVQYGDGRVESSDLGSRTAMWGRSSS